MSSTRSASRIVLRTHRGVVRAHVLEGFYDGAGVDVLIKNRTGSRFLKADIGELVAIAGASIDPAEVTMLQTYLDTKYGL